MNRSWQDLNQYLVERKLITQEALTEVMQDTTDKRSPLIRLASIIDNNILRHAVSQAFGIIEYDITAQNDQAIEALDIPASLLDRYKVIPMIMRDNSLLLAMADPTDEQIINQLQFQIGYDIIPVVCSVDAMADRIDVIRRNSQEGFELATSNIDADIENLEILDESGDTSANEVKDIKEDGTAGPIIRFVNNVLLDAIKSEASDIHFEPYEDIYRIRIRHDGILRTMHTPPANLANRFAARIKVMANLDISEKRKAQDGRIRLRLGTHSSIDFRVSVLPTLYGEKVVFRILDSSAAILDINVLGYDEEQKKLFVKTIHLAQGMILVTGPTGSGKTVSLYTGLNMINDDQHNISTAEDPVEINLRGVNQVHVTAKGMDFSTALRAFLRQDPDVIMVGEIRDLETAKIAIQASQTGHLVLSTLHTNNSLETVARMLHMGIAAYDLAAAVKLITAQRLVRKVCEYCRQQVTDLERYSASFPINDVIKRFSIEKVVLYKAVGCRHCNNTGYAGRVGIYELLPITKKLSYLLIEGANIIELEKAAREEGFYTMYESGIRKALTGITTLEEISRVTIVQ